MEEIKPGELTGVHYAVFGCGDHDWASTYQYVPRFIDEQLAYPVHVEHWRLLKEPNCKKANYL